MRRGGGGDTGDRFESAFRTWDVCEGEQKEAQHRGEAQGGAVPLPLDHRDEAAKT